MEKKSYSEDEIAAIMGNAARLQAVQGVQGKEGLTLEEIKAAAADAGIEPGFIEVASSEVATHKQSYLSLPTAINRTQIVRGQLSEERWISLVGQFVRAFGGPGNVEIQGNRRIWTQDGVRITVEEMGDQIIFTAQENWGKGLELPIAFFLVGLFATLAMALLSVTSLESSIIMATLGMAFLLFGSFFTYRKRKAQRQDRTLEKFDSVLNKCAMLLQDEHLLSDSPSNYSGTLKKGEIDIPDEEVYVVQPGVSRRKNDAGMTSSDD